MNNDLITSEFMTFSLRHSGDELVKFVAADVCSALNIKNVTMAMKTVSPEYKTTLNINEGGRSREVNAVLEPGLYEMILKSRKPEAKKFQKWVCEEVLPNIRKNGLYALAQKAQITEMGKAMSRVVIKDLFADDKLRKQWEVE